MNEHSLYKINISFAGRALVFVVTVLALFSINPSFADARALASECYNFGDVDHTGAIGTLDTDKINQYLFFGVPLDIREKYRADVNDSGPTAGNPTIDVGDRDMIADYYNFIRDDFPVCYTLKRKPLFSCSPTGNAFTDSTSYKKPELKNTVTLHDELKILEHEAGLTPPFTTNEFEQADVYDHGHPASGSRVNSIDASTILQYLEGLINDVSTAQNPNRSCPQLNVNSFPVGGFSISSSQTGIGGTTPYSRIGFEISNSNTLTANSLVGYNFDSWTGNCGSISGNICTVGLVNDLLTDSKTVQANYSAVVPTPIPPTPTPIPALPDLVIRNTSCGTNPLINVSGGSILGNTVTVTPGVNVTFTFNTCNIGAGSAGASTTVVEAFGSANNASNPFSVGTLATNSSAAHTFTTSWPASGNSYSMVFEADYGDNVKESNENNNDVTLTVVAPLTPTPTPTLTPTPTPVPTCTISGDVFIDDGAGGGTPGNGAREPTELRYVATIIRSGNGSLTATNCTADAATRTVTSCDNTNPGYSFTGLTYGQYDVTLSPIPDGYLLHINTPAQRSATVCPPSGATVNYALEPPFITATPAPTSTPAPTPTSGPTPTPVPSIYTISGTVFRDNGNGEEGIANNGVWDGTEPKYTATPPTIKIGTTNPTNNSGGDYTFSGLAGSAGGINYNVELTVPSGYTITNNGENPNTNPRSVVVQLANVSNVNFGIRSTSATPTPTPTNTPSNCTISGTVYIDYNGNNIRDAGDGGYYSGVSTPIFIYLNNYSTNTSGFYSASVPSGTHSVTLTVPSGYIPSATNNPPLYATVCPNATDKDFGIRPTYTISGNVFIDDGRGTTCPGPTCGANNGARDGTEPLYTGGSALVSLLGTGTALNTLIPGGTYSFSSLIADTYWLFLDVAGGYQISPGSINPRENIVLPPTTVVNFGIILAPPTPTPTPTPTPVPNTISGNVFVDDGKCISPGVGCGTPKDGVKNGTEGNYTLGTSTVQVRSGVCGTGTLIGSSSTANGAYSVGSIPAGNYVVCYTSLPSGYYLTFPTNGPPPSFTVTVGPSKVNLNFGIAPYGAWIQSTGTDIRLDNGFNYYIPSTATQACGGAYASINGGGGTPGIIFTGGSSANFGGGSASSKNWVVGGTSYPELFTPTKGNVIKTSYKYIDAQIKQAGLTRTDIAPYCTLTNGGGGAGLDNCILPAASLDFPRGLYVSDGSIVQNGSVVLDPPPLAPPAFVAKSNAKTTNPETSLQWDHTVVSGNNRLLVVGVSILNNSGQTLATTTGVKYNGENMTRLGNSTNGTLARVEIWYLKDASLPTDGIPHTIVATLTSGNAAALMGGGATSWSNVDQIIPFRGSFRTAIGTTSRPRVSDISTGTYDVVVDTVGMNPNATNIKADDQIGDWNQPIGGGQLSLQSGGSHKTSTSTPTTMEWIFGSNSGWAASAISIQPPALRKYDFPESQNYVILVNGDLTINTQIKVPKTSTVAFIVSGDIIVNPTVGNTTGDITTTTPSIEGFYSTDKNFIIKGNNNCTVGEDKRLNVAGSVVVNAGLTGGEFRNQRDLCGGNATCPVFSIQERPDFMLNAPDLIKYKNTIYQEVAP